MEPGDKVQMVDLTSHDNPIVNVVVVELHPNGKLIVEDTQGPKPRRRWLTGAGFLQVERL